MHEYSITLKGSSEEKLKKGEASSNGQTTGQDNIFKSHKMTPTELLAKAMEGIIVIDYLVAGDGYT